MRFSLESSAGVNLVRRYGDGAVQIGERRFATAVLVGARSLAELPGIAAPEALTESALAVAVQATPEILIVGAGEAAPRVATSLRRALGERGIGVETMGLGAACRTYNVLAQEGRDVMALLYPR